MTLRPCALILLAAAALGAGAVAAHPAETADGS